MTTYHVIYTKYENDNTAEFGFGDFPVRTNYVGLTVEADTRRKAMNVAKKTDPNLGFGGQFGNMLYADDELPSYLQKTLGEIK
mgnify:FL=1|tara:strand:- start:38 stop:286 length:249 start_codon:yes stop_codon:yes gene_type:complete